MLNKFFLNQFLIALCVLGLSLAAQAQDKTTTKKIKKTVTTTTEEVDASGKVIKKTEKVETSDDATTEAPAATPAPAPTTSKPQPPPGMPTINEDWYSLWGLGVSSTSYSGEIGDDFESLEDAAGADRSSAINMDLLGFYWPLEGHKTMLGVILNGTSETIDLAGSDDDATLTTSMISFSAHHFFGKNIGDGFFLRGDVGIARAGIDIPDGGSSRYDETSSGSVGFLAGAGYGMPLGVQTRILFGLYFRPLPELKFNNGEKLKGNVTNFTVGFLF